ncbi:hypothetical protein [Priestia megaterium]|uniref:hypothetical protein n=1 Tax=Priestia megaterium TaxID=1404 RepID=UPI00101CE298|nr:hypothetical protein [Priestia megaterium]
MRIIACAALAFLLSACTDPEGAGKVLAQNGYKDIKQTGYSWFGCSEEDLYHTGFTATTPAGAEVSGVVCSGIGWGKAYTIRFFD